MEAPVRFPLNRWQVCFDNSARTKRSFLAAMTTAYDAGLLICDPAFDTVHAELGMRKTDLG